MIVDVYTTNTHYGQRQAANTPLLAVDRREVKRLVRNSRSHLGLGRPDLRRLGAAIVAAGDADDARLPPAVPGDLGHGDGEHAGLQPGRDAVDVGAGGHPEPAPEPARGALGEDGGSGSRRLP